MISEIALTIVNLALVGLHVLTMKQEKDEKRKLINALIAKDATELRDLETEDKKEAPKPPAPPDLIPESEMSPEEFEKLHA